MAVRIDLNADLGEERGDDDAIFQCISSANVASGAYAGGSRALNHALASAARLGVTVGAHIGYADRENFGRVVVEIDQTTLTESLREQIARLQDAASRYGLAIRYVKPHGALYHRVGADASHAQALIDAVRACDPRLELLVPMSPMLEALAAPLRCRQEFFADRGYHLDGRLVERSDPRAHIESVEELVERTLTWLRTGELVSVEGKHMRIIADSICLHGDSPNAVRAAQALRAALTSEGYRICNWMTP